VVSERIQHLDRNQYVREQVFAVRGQSDACRRAPEKTFSKLGLELSDSGQNGWESDCAPGRSRFKAALVCERLYEF
jgi:hypothetical protein